jgi:CheY-like chemotaxis protein
MTIVVVDDSITNMIVLKRLSASVAHDEIVGFTSATEALTYLKQQPAEAVVVDYEMPDLDGISFIRELRLSERHRATAVLMVTGNGDSEIKTAASAAGATDFLSKPVRVQEFKSLLGHYLQDHLK